MATSNDNDDFILYVTLTHQYRHLYVRAAILRDQNFGSVLYCITIALIHQLSCSQPFLKRGAIIYQ